MVYWALGISAGIAVLFAIAVWILTRLIFAEPRFAESLAKTVCVTGEHSLLLQVVGVTENGALTQETYRSMSFTSGDLPGFTYRAGGAKFGNELEKIEKIEIKPNLIEVTVAKDVSKRSPFRFPNPEDGCAENVRDYVSSNEILSRVLGPS